MTGNSYLDIKVDGDTITLVITPDGAGFAYRMPLDTQTARELVVMLTDALAHTSSSS